jgi:radical SAM protein with 4Fe4S-binding SPASM domain
MKLKNLLSPIIPKSFRKQVKDFYYGVLLRSAYSAKHKFFYNKWDFFETIAIETTTHCNLRCKFCPNSKYERGLLKNKKLMDSKLFKKIINELSEIGYRGNVDLYSYGEPLTDERLPELIDYSRKKLPKANIEINSNGFLLTLEIYKNLLKKGLDKINISQYGDSMPPNTKNVLDCINKNPSVKNIIHYRILNQKELSNRGGEIQLETSPNYERPICGYPNAAQTIDYAGNWVLCCNDYHSEISFGNLNQESLLAIWNKPIFKKIRKETRNSVFRLQICRKCVGLER